MLFFFIISYKLLKMIFENNFCFLDPSGNIKNVRQIYYSVDPLIHLVAFRLVSTIGPISEWPDKLIGTIQVSCRPHMFNYADILSHCNNTSCLLHLNWQICYFLTLRFMKSLFLACNIAILISHFFRNEYYQKKVIWNDMKKWF